MSENTWNGNLTTNEVAMLLNNTGTMMKDENDLIQIMEDMGLLIYYEEKWVITEEAIKYTIGNRRVLGDTIWLPSVLDAIREFLHK